MISFRYHLVSLVAVLLALAGGVVIGTVALSGPVTSDLHNQVNDLKGQRSDLTRQVGALQQRATAADSVATTFGGRIVAGALKDQTTLVVALPGAKTDSVDAVYAELRAAGAKQVGRMTLASDYVAESSKTAITSLVTSVHPSNLQLSETSDAGRLGAELLSFVLLGQAADTDRQAVLTAFSQSHLITSDPAQATPAKAVVVVGSGKEADGSYPAASENALVTALQSRGGTVLVAGDGASASGDGIVAQVRGGATKSTVSTVDDIDSAFGPATVVLTLQQALNGRVGHFGTASGADAVFPQANG